MSIREDEQLRKEGERLKSLEKEIKNSSSSCDFIIKELLSWRDGLDAMEPPIAPLLRSLTLLQRIRQNVLESLWKLKELELVKELVMEGEEKIKFFFPAVASSNKRILQRDLILPFMEEIDQVQQALSNLNDASKCETFEEPIIQSAYHLLDEKYSILLGTFENFLLNNIKYENGINDFIEFSPSFATPQYYSYITSIKSIYITFRMKTKSFNGDSNYPPAQHITASPATIIEWTRKFFSIKQEEDDLIGYFHIPIILEKIDSSSIIAAIMEPLSLCIMDACVSVFGDDFDASEVENCMWVLSLYGDMKQCMVDDPLILQNVLSLIGLKSQQVIGRIESLITKNHTLRPSIPSSLPICPYVISGIDIMKSASSITCMDEFYDRIVLFRRIIVSLEGALAYYGDQIRKPIVKKIFMINNYSYIKASFEGNVGMTKLMDDCSNDGTGDHSGIVEHYTNVIGSLKEQYMDMWMYCMSLLVIVNGRSGIESKPLSNRYLKGIPSPKDQLKGWSSEWSEIISLQSSCIIVDNVVRMGIINSIHENVIGHFDQFSKENPSLWEDGNNKALSIENLAKMIDSLFRK